MSRERYIESTQSVCRSRFRLIPADVIERDGCLYLRKRCPEHGLSECLHIYDFPQLYRAMRRIFCQEATRPVYPHELVAYITSECNLKCPVCYANAGEGPSKELSGEDILRNIRKYKGRFVHFSGGEPTLRQDLFDLIAAVKKKKFCVGLFSNGLNLRHYDYVHKIKQAGVDLVILSFESLRDEHYLRLKGARLLEAKMLAFENICKAGLHLYLFCSVAPGINEDEIPELIDFAKKHLASVDIMNFTPIWRIGRYNNFERIPASRIYRQFEKCGIHFSDMLCCTEFSHLFFEILSKLLGQKWVRHPPCEQIVYFIKIGPQICLITEIIDLPFLTERLRRINRKITGRCVLARWGLFVFGFPWLFFLREFFKRPELRRLAWLMARDLLSGLGIKRTIASRKLTVMTGQVHGLDDADFRFMKKCTLYAINENAQGFQSFCTRQMHCEFARH